jgi:hypothetical protein
MLSAELRCNCLILNFHFFFKLEYIFNFAQGIECNEKLDGGVDKLLLEWQLKYNMIGWSGGFMNVSLIPLLQKKSLQIPRSSVPFWYLHLPLHPAVRITRFSIQFSSQDSVGYESIDVFLPRNPPGETAADIAREEAKGEKGYGVKIQAEQQHRMTSIVKVMLLFQHSFNLLSLVIVLRVYLPQLITFFLFALAMSDISSAHALPWQYQVLAHYEAQVITPFSVLGVTVTKQFLTLIVGFFGAAVAGVSICSRA